MNTQLSRFSDLAAQPLHLAIQFRANGSHIKPALNDVGHFLKYNVRLFFVLPKVGKHE
jgi:hypothetical protein